MGSNQQQRQRPAVDPAFDGDAGSDHAVTPAQIAGAWVIVLSLFAMLALGSEFLAGQANGALAIHGLGAWATPVDAADANDR